MRFEYDRFRGFVEEHSGDLSLGGMFVKTTSAPPVGTVVPLEFRLDDGYELIRGTAKVIWVRAEADGPDRPAGMGLRFLELTSGSRELIFKVVERRVKEGEPTFDLDDAPEGATAEPGGGEEAAPADTPAELARPRWTSPPSLEATDPGRRPSEADPVAATRGPAAGSAISAEAPPVGAAALPEEPAGEAEAPPSSVDPGSSPGSSEAGRGVHVADAPHPAPPATKPEPWEMATPWKATPIGPRWVATDETTATEPATDPEAEPAANPAANPPDPWEESGVVFVPPAIPPGSSASRTNAASPAETPDPVPAPGYATRLAGAASRRKPRAIGRGLALAAVLVLAAGAAAFLTRDRWLGAEAGETGEGPGSEVLLLPEELNPPAGGRGPDLGPPAVGGVTAGPAAAVGAVVGPDGTAGPAGPAEPPADSAGTGALSAASPSPAAGAGPEAADGSREPRAEEPPVRAAGPRARRVRDITWSDRGGSVDFLIWGDGALDPGDVRHFTIGGERPRLVVRIPGIDQPFSRGRIEVGGALVERIRTGLHADGRPSELHVVFDLTDDSVRLAGIEEVGGRLRVTVERAVR